MGGGGVNSILNAFISCEQLKSPMADDFDNQFLQQLQTASAKPGLERFRRHIHLV